MCFTQKFKMATKNGGKTIFGKSHQLTLLITCLGGKKFRPNCCISHRFPDKCVFTLYAEIQDGRQKWQENDFGENSPVDSRDTLALKNFKEIALSRTVFEIFTLFYFPLKSKMAAISCENLNFSLFNKTPLYYPVGQKFTQNCSISYNFGDIYTFLVSAKIQDGHQKFRKLKIFVFTQDNLLLPFGLKICSKSLYRFLRYKQITQKKY